MEGASVHPVWGLPSLAPRRLIGARRARQGYGDMDWPGAHTLLSHLPLPMWLLIYHKTFAFQEIGIPKVQNGNLKESPVDPGSSLVVTQPSLSGNHLPGWGLQLASALEISLAQVLHPVIMPATVASYLMDQQLSVWHRQTSIWGRFLGVVMMLQNGKGDPEQQSMKLWQKDHGLWPCITDQSPTLVHSHLCYILAPHSPLLISQMPSAQFSREAPGCIKTY